MGPEKNPQFDEFARNYDQELTRGLRLTGHSKDFFARGRARWIEKKLRQINLLPNRLLDFGCGTGGSIQTLKALTGNAEVVGVDVSQASLNTAKQLHRDTPGIRFASPEELPPAESFDLACCNGVFHHIPLPQRPAAIDYVLRSLRPGGLFALWENNPWNPGTRFIMSRISFDRDAITLSPPQARQMARAAGFEILSTDFLFIFPRILAWLRWIEPALSRLPLGGQYVVLCRRPIK